MFTLLILIVLLPLVMLRPKVGLVVLVFLLAFMPRYVGIGVGEAGFALTPRRVAMFATVAALAAAFLVQPAVFARLSGFLRENRWLIVLFVAMYAVKLAATLVNSGVGVNLVYVIDDLLLFLVPALCFLLVVRTARDETSVVFGLVLALLFSAILATIESIRGDVLLQGLVDVSVEEAGVGGLTSKVRADTYRAKAMFDNPLLLAEFVCIVWPWACYLWLTGRSLLARWSGFAGLVAAPVALYLAHTRSGWLIFAIGVSFFIAVRFWDRSGRLARLPLGLAYVAAVAALGLAAYTVADRSLDYLASGFVGSQSVVERLSQYVVVAGAWLDSPIIGYGMTRNYGFDLDFLNHIDNYWLRLILEGGTLLVMMFMVFTLTVFLSAMRQRSQAPTREYRLFMTAVCVSIVSFCAYKLFLSMPTNNAYFLLIAALAARRKYWHSRMYPVARTALSQ